MEKTKGIPPLTSIYRGQFLLITLSLLSSVFSYSTKVEAGRFNDFKDWLSERITTKATPPKEIRNSQKFNEPGRVLIEEIPFSDTDVQNGLLEAGRFIVNQDADHPDSLRSISLFDQERQLQYTKEEGIGKKGKKTLYFDPQADAPYWKKNGEWCVTAPYIFGYSKERYSTREALEQRLDALFQARVLKYRSSSCKVVSRKPEGVILQTDGETTIASNIYDMHQFYLKHDLKSYAAYLYEGEETPSLLKSLGLLTMIVGAGIVDGINVQKLIPSRVNEDPAAESEGGMNFGELALMTTTAFAAPKFLPIYLLLRASQSLGVKGEYQQQDIYCEKDGSCTNENFFHSSIKNSSIAQNDNVLCEHLMKNLTDNYLGMGELPCRDNIVYLLGKTGAGKSTFLNYIAGKSFSATKDGLETIIKMDDPIAEIGHGSISKTFKPTLWKQEKTGNLPLCYYDTPGLSDNRGAAYDIIKAFFLQSLGNEVNSLRIILLAEEDSLVDKRGQGFVELATDLEKLVGKEGIKRLYDTTSLIITKSKHSLSDIRREIEKKVKDFKSEEVRGLFQALLDKKRIKNLKKIEEGNYSSGQALGEETPATYEALIRSTTPITPYFLDSQNQNRSLFNIVVSSDTFRTIVECSDFFNNNIKKAVGNLGENIQAHYANLLKEQMPLNDTIVKSWHTSWKNLRDQELKNLSIETPQGLLNRLTENVKKNNITDTSQRNTTLVLKILKQQGDYLSFFKKIPEMVIQYLTDSWIAGLAPLVNNLEQLEKIHSNGTYFQTEQNTTLVIKGYFPKMDLIVNELNKNIYKNITDVRIFGLETLTFNRNFLLPQGNVSIISPQWILSGDPHNAVSRDKWMIDLKGKDAQILAIPQAENAPHSTGQDGKDGSPGKPGQSGGNFFGIGDYFFDGILTININGGKGGDGQHGGHGDNGKDGIDADLNAVSTDDKDGEWETEGSGIGIWHKPSQKYCYKNGVSGGKGGNGGKGGEKGQGGLGGESILIRLQELQAEKLNGTQGSSGDEGRAGHYGTGGKHGKRAIAEYYYTKKGDIFFRWKLSQRYPDAAPNPTHALSGFSPSEKNSEGQVQPSSQNTINIPEVINGYKIFWRDSINQLEKPEYQHNIMIQAQKDLLKSFLQKLEDHSEVKKKSNSSSFAKELTSLEEQYVQLKELNFLPHYKSFLFRIKEYAHDTSQLAPADQKALRFLQTTTLSRICHLQAVSEPSLVTDIPGFLKFIKKNIQIFEELEKEKQIDFYKEEYQQHIVPKIQEANDFIKLLGKEVKETNDTLNNHINKLMKEIKDLKEKKIEEQKDLIQKQEDLRKAMPLKMFLNVLSLGTKGLGFLGETGKMVGGLFDAGLGGIRSGFLPSSSDQDKLNAFPKAVDNMINIVQQSANELSPETSTQQSVIEERLNEQALYFNQGTGEWAAFKVNYEKIKSPQVKEEILKNLEKDTKHNKSSKEKQKVILEKAKVSVDVALAGVNFYNEYKSDQSQMEELSRAIKKSKEELKKCEVLERKVSEEFTPYVEEVKKTVSNFQNNQDKSSVALDVQKWNIRKYLMNVQDVIQDFTEGFNVEKDFRRSLEKMKGALETVLQLYERIQNFQDQMTLASYVANLQTPYFSDMPKEEPLHSELLNLKKMTNNYIILERYAKAINAVQQWAFPFESYFVGEFENLHFNKTLSIEDTVNRAIGNLGKLEDRVEQYETTIVNSIDKDIVKSDFRLKYKGNRPFFTWNFSNYEREIKKVLQGEEVILKAEIFPNTLSAVKFNKMELALSHSNSTQDASLQEMLKNYRFTLTHQGDSFYKWKNQTYKISSGAFKISCHFERMKETQEPNGCNPIYEKLAGKYYLLSPYAYWAIGIEPSEQLSDSDREFYKQGLYNIFNDSLSQINLHLVGYGSYVREGI